MAESLEKIYDRYKAAEEIAVYKKSDASMVIMEKAEFDAQDEKFKSQYKGYAEYVAVQKAQINLVKDAMKVKLAELKTVISTNNNFDAAEKTQYNSELDAAIGAITPLSAPVEKIKEK